MEYLNQRKKDKNNEIIITLSVSKIKSIVLEIFIKKEFFTTSKEFIDKSNRVKNPL